MKSFCFRFLILTLCTCAILLQGCGGGGGGGITPSPDFTLSASNTSLSLRAGSSTSLQLTVSALNGFTGNITIQATGLPAGVTTTPTLPMTLAVPGSQSVTVSVLATVATGNYPVTISGTSGALSHSVNGTLTIQAPLQFSLSVSPTTSSVVAGNSTTFQFSMSADNGFSDNVTIQVTGLPSGMTLSPSLPFTWNGPASQTMTVNADTSVVAGGYTLTFTGSTSSGLSHSTQETVTVQPPPPPSFTLDVSPPSLTLTAGTVGTFQISVVPANGFSGPVGVQITGLPANASLAPSSPFTIAASPQTVTVTTTMALAAGTYDLSIQGSSGSLSASGNETLNVQLATPPPSRSDFVRTDDQPQAVAYDQLHQRVYVTNPVAGTVDAISTTTYQILRRIPVSEPYGIDITPDNSTVFIGTLTQALYAMDTATMALTARYIAPLQTDPTSPNWFWPQPPTNPVATPDDCALVSLFGSPLVNGRIVKWNPKTGQTTTVVSSATVPLGGSQYPDAQGDPMYPSAVSADHTKVVVTNDLSSSRVYLFDTTKNAFIQNIVFSDYISALAANPNGSQFAAAGSSIYILDANLNTIATIAAGGRPIYSADGKYLYLSAAVGDGGIPEILIYDTTGFNLVGTAPDFSVTASSAGTNLYDFPLAVDETGRIFGDVYNGLAIADTTDLRTFPGGTSVYPFYATPDTGPVGVAQTVQISSQYNAVPAVWFGPLPSPNTSIESGYVTTLAPTSSQDGTVNIRIERPDNVQAWVTQGYTYGAVLSPEPELAAANDGSTTIDLYGYGLDPYNSSAPATTVSFGSYDGTVTGYRNITGSVSPYDLAVQTPPMPVGESDVTATSASGSSTLHSIFHAVDVHTSALDGTAASIAYDAGRNQIYVAVTDHVDVYSLASNAFIATFAIPTLNGLKNLGGMAVTPDGKWLIVTNSTDASVAVIDPDNPSGAIAVAVGTTTLGNGPSQVAATNTSRALVMADADGIWILNLNTMTATPTNNLLLNGYFIAASPDGSKVCLAYPPQNLALYDSATASVTVGPQAAGNGHAAQFCYVNGGIVVSGSDLEGWLATVSNLKLVPIVQGSLTLYEFLELRQSSGDLCGLAADNTGALIYMLYGDKVVLFDAHNGDYRERIELPTMAQPLQNYLLDDNAIAINETGDQMFVITVGGLTTVQLDSLPLAIGSITVSGGVWNVAGTGFVAGTTVTVDGNSLPVTFTDSQHIQVAGAPGLNTVHTITLTNPDGHTYTYDAAYFR